MLLLAQQLPPPSGEELNSWLVTAAAVFGLVLLAAEVYRRFWPKPSDESKRISSLKSEFEARLQEKSNQFTKDLTALERSHGEKITELKEAIDDQVRHANSSRRLVYDRLGMVEQNVSGLSADLKNVQVQNATMGAQIANLIGKVSAALALVERKKD